MDIREYEWIKIIIVIREKHIECTKWSEFMLVSICLNWFEGFSEFFKVDKAISDFSDDMWNSFKNIEIIDIAHLEGIEFPILHIDNIDK
jgi:hypothetical protein